MYQYYDILCRSACVYMQMTIKLQLPCQSALQTPPREARFCQNSLNFLVAKGSRLNRAARWTVPLQLASTCEHGEWKPKSKYFNGRRSIYNTGAREAHFISFPVSTPRVHLSLWQTKILPSTVNELRTCERANQKALQHVGRRPSMPQRDIFFVDLPQHDNTGAIPWLFWGCFVESK